MIEAMLENNTKVAARKRLYWALSFLIEMNLSEYDDLIKAAKVAKDKGAPPEVLIMLTQKLTEKMGPLWAIFQSLQDNGEAFGGEMPEFCRFLFKNGCDHGKAKEYASYMGEQLDMAEKHMKSMADAANKVLFQKTFGHHHGLRGSIFDSKFEERSMATKIKGEK